MSLRKTLLSAGLIFATVQTALAEQVSPMLEMDADGEVQIATDGHVSDYRLQSTLTPAVATLVDRNVRSWQFKPVLIDGAAVVAKTAMHLKLKADPIADKDSYSVRIISIDFGEPKQSPGVKPPRYPEEAVSARLGAKVLIAARLDASGQVIDVQPYQTSLDARARSEHQAEQWRKVFEKVTVAAVKTWHYDLTETLNGKSIGTNVIVPVEFSMSPSTTRNSEGWKAFVPGPVHPAPWMNSTPMAEQREFPTLPTGQALSLDSHFQLKDEVIGKTL